LASIEEALVTAIVRGAFGVAGALARALGEGVPFGDP